SFEGNSTDNTKGNIKGSSEGSLKGLRGSKYLKDDKRFTLKCSYGKRFVLEKLLLRDSEYDEKK
ncbi:7795_t:CDS:1, partial [Funneliformis caledonium]